MKNYVKFIIVCLLLNMIFIFTDIDLYLEKLFYNGEWYLDGLPFLRWMYSFAPIIPIATAITGLFIYLYYKVKKNNLVRQKIGAFLILSMLLGPGLVVNTLGKGFMGRPRPKHIIQFGGQEEFLPPLVLGRFIPHLLKDHNWGKKHLGLKFVQGKHNSFPSGHASVVFYLIFPYFMIKKRKISYLMPGFIAGWIMGIVRMAQGGHFFTDIFWAFIAVFGVNYLIAKTMKLKEVSNYAEER